MNYENNTETEILLSEWKTEMAETMSFETYGDEETWKIARQKGIGGSDAGAILGLNKYMSPYQVYLSKTVGASKNLDNNMYVKKGKILEPYIFTEYVVPYCLKNNLYPAICKDTMILHSNPIFRANVDGLLFSPHGSLHSVIEIKLVFEYSEDKWYGKECQGIPATYYAQVQYYMSVTGAQSALVVAFFDRTWEPHFFNISRDDAFIYRMGVACVEFWTQNVTIYNPPALDAEKDKEYLPEFLEKAPKGIPTTTMTDVLKEYQLVTAKIKQLEETQKINKDILINGYLAGQIPHPSAGKVTMTEVTANSLNQKDLQKDLPDVYERYRTVSKYVRTSIK